MPNSTSGEHYKLESHLKRNGELCVEFGAGGWRAFNYKIRKGQDLEVGFLKIYLSNQPVDLSSIQQQSASQETRSPCVRYTERLYTWDTILIPIIQRRNPHPSSRALLPESPLPYYYGKDGENTEAW